MLGGARNNRHRTDLPLQPPDGPQDLELQQRNAVSELVERQPFEDDIGKAAIGGRAALPLLRLDQRVGQLLLPSPVDPHLDIRQVELAPIGPDAPDAGDLALAESDGEVGEVTEALHLRPARLAARALARHLLLEARRPDQRAADARRPVKPVDRGALVGAGDARRRQPCSGDRPPSIDQRAIDDAPGQSTRRASEDRTDRTEHAAERRARRLEENRGHGNNPPIA